MRLISNPLKVNMCLSIFGHLGVRLHRLGNKKLVKLHNEVSSSKVEIIGISIDTDATKWLKAIEKDKIKFTQLIDPKGFDANSSNTI
jgi:hypothetical protein